MSEASLPWLGRLLAAESFESTVLEFSLGESGSSLPGTRVSLEGERIDGKTGSPCAELRVA